MLNITNTSNVAYTSVNNSNNFPLRLLDNGTGMHSLLHFRQKDNGDVFIGALGDGTANRADFIVKQDNDGTFIETLRIKHSGNVGIGTSTPGYKLTVGEGTVGTKLSFHNTVPYGIGYVATGETGVFANNDYASAKVHLGMQDATTFYPKLTVQKDGKVGIGTTTPSKALSISGDLHVTTGNITREGSDGFTF
jgi:hypothetical protein